MTCNIEAITSDTFSSGLLHCVGRVLVLIADQDEQYIRKQQKSTHQAQSDEIMQARDKV